MKRVVTMLMLVSVILAMLPSLVLADAPSPGGPFNTAFRVQNLGGDVAHCQYVFYNSTGSAAFTSSEATIAVGDSLYVYVPGLSGLASGSYSGVVSCDQEVAAVVNYSDSNSGASHSGVSGQEISDTWYAPGIYDNFYNFYSNIYVQNASSDAVDITVSIYAAGSTTPVKTQTATAVPANAAVSFEQEGLSELATNVPYSAKVVATGDVAVVVNIYGRSNVLDQLYSYNPFTSGSTESYAPVVMNAYYGYNTSITVQNIGSNSTPVTVTYGTGQQWTGTIASNAAEQLYSPGSGIPVGSLTSAVVQSGGEPIVVLVNESTNKNRAASYSGFSEGSTSVRAPIVMRRYYKYNTSITCQNVGTDAATMTISYGGVSGTSSSPTIAKGKTHLFYQPGDTLISDGFIGSATITSSQPIVCVINEDQNESPQSGVSMDQLYAYNSILE